MNTPAKEPVLKADQETLRAAWAIQEDEIEISLREKLAQLKSATKAHAQDLNARADSVTNQGLITYIGPPPFIVYFKVQQLYHVRNWKFVDFFFLISRKNSQQDIKVTAAEEEQKYSEEHYQHFGNRTGSPWEYRKFKTCINSAQ